MKSNHESTQLEEQILGAIHRDSLSDLEFNDLAMDVFGYQFGHNLPYRRYCQALGVSPDQISSWKEIPSISTDAFKVVAHPLTTCPDLSPSHIFQTSGTTSDVRGRHLFPSIAMYEAAIIEGWKQLSLPKPQTVVFLTPHPEHAPNSSLSHMMGVLAAHYSEANIIWSIRDDGSMDFETITRLASGGGPVAMLGTAIAFLHLFEHSAAIQLPSGSFAMETGGYKGTHRRLEKEELYSLFNEKLSLSPENVINEYSMTELSSQFYTRGLGDVHRGPHWTRVRIIDPRTGKEAAPGEPGHVAIYDLANLHSVSALQTQDLAVAGPDGSFTLLGRDPTALPRGCSRAADHALQSR
ncbi:coenzyme F390 synthetase [Oceaniferula spumae]|uniref:Coenzyme F390 synthetase n=1 Tax=Oceaniferula spumae TaxID=2979115 RepID=A0AAT9FHP9_9BACT